MTAPAEATTLTPQAVAAATVALCRPRTFDRRSIDEVTGTVILTLRSGPTVTIRRRSWAAGGGLHWSCRGLGGDLPHDRFEAVEVMVTVCESRARA
ncbi:hypothetical protein ACFVH4_19205 [Nocardia ignorata]|uniref:hypothetical protein n=1 Tax=Nocardia ignorata TaxID=145285 RepID=UPI003634F416